MTHRVGQYLILPVTTTVRIPKTKTVKERGSPDRKEFVRFLGRRTIHSIYFHHIPTGKTWKFVSTDGKTFSDGRDVVTDYGGKPQRLTLEQVIKEIDRMFAPGVGNIVVNEMFTTTVKRSDIQEEIDFFEDIIKPETRHVIDNRKYYARLGK